MSEIREPRNSDISKPVELRGARSNPQRRRFQSRNTITAIEMVQEKRRGVVAGVTFCAAEGGDWGKRKEAAGFVSPGMRGN
jgi:hypothetical protein